MRKKTIEEELREIADEKVDHIQQLEKDFGHSKKHSFDFSPENSGEELKNVSFSESKTSQTSTETEQKTESKSPFDNLKEKLEKSQTAKQNALKKQSPVVAAVVLALFVAVGLVVMIVFGAVPWAKSTTFVSVQGSVASVYTFTDDDKTYAHLQVAYEFRNNTYTAPIKKNVTGRAIPKVGDSITIKINPKNPEEAQSTDMPYIFPFFFGLAFTIISIIMESSCIAQAVRAKKHI